MIKVTVYHGIVRSNGKHSSSLLRKSSEPYFGKKITYLG
jgi:hypothetical protein